MEYSINAHSSIRVADDKVIYFDPFKIEEERHDADVVFITHSHYDHLDPESIEKVAGEDTLFVLPRSCEQDAMNAGLSEAKCRFLVPGESILVKGLEVRGIPAYNMGKDFHPMKNRWLGYVVTIGGKRIYVMGDTDDNPYTRNAQFDVLFIPVGGKYTMNHEDAAFYVNEMQPELAIPTHYGSIVGRKDDGEKFKNLVEGDTKVELIIE